MTRFLFIPLSVMILLLVLSASNVAFGQGHLNSSGPPLLNDGELIALDQRTLTAQLLNDRAFFDRHSLYIHYEIDERGSHVRWPSKSKAPVQYRNTVISGLSDFTVERYGDVAFVSSLANANIKRNGTNLRRIGVYLKGPTKWIFVASLIEPELSAQKHLNADKNLATEKQMLLKLHQDLSAAAVSSDTLNRILAPDVLVDVDKRIWLVTSNSRAKNQIKDVQDREEAIQELAKLLSKRKVSKFIQGLFEEGDPENYQVEVYKNRLAAASMEIPHRRRIGNQVEEWRSRRVHIYVKDNEWRLILWSSVDKLPGSDVTYNLRTIEQGPQGKQSEGEQSEQTQKTTPATVAWEDYNRPLKDLSRSIESLREKPGKNIEQVKALADKMKIHSDFLLQQWSSACCESGPATYLESLEQNVSLLKSVLENKIEEKEVLPVLEVVERDLGIKAAHCKLSPRGWDALVEVLVNAKKGNEIIQGLEVWFVPKGWVKDQNKWRRFAKVTSGTSEKLAPGVYMMWLKGSQSVPIDIGGSGAEKKEVDLSVPQ